MRTLPILALAMVISSAAFVLATPEDQTGGPASGPSRASPDELKQVTLVPVYDPRCSGPMPILQKYREVPIAEANAPPKCRR